MATRRLRKRSRRRRQRETITQQFNKYAAGLSYFGIETSTKKRATTKQLKQLKKEYYKARKSLREAGYIDLPTIAQITKEIQQAKTETEPEIDYRQIPEGREELPYAEGAVPYEDMETYAIDEFKAIMAAASEAINTYINSTTKAWIDEIENCMAKLEGAIDNYGEEYVDNFLSQSPTFNELRIATFASYDDTKAAVSDIIDVTDALLDSMRYEMDM